MGSAYHEIWHYKKSIKYWVTAAYIKRILNTVTDKEVRV